MKVCTKCGRRLPYGEFYRLARGGLRADCRSCVRDGQRARAEQFARGEIDAPHGKLSTYTNLGCRCVPCSQEMSDYQASRRPFRPTAVRP